MTRRIRHERVRQAMLVAAAILLCAVLAPNSGCGGGGGHLAPPQPPMMIASTALPECRIGDPVHHLVPVCGGWGGPYSTVLKGGRLPPGLRTHDDPPALIGTPSQAGTYEFRLLVVDRGGGRWLAQTATQFAWTILGRDEVEGRDEQ